MESKRIKEIKKCIGVISNAEYYKQIKPYLIEAITYINELETLCNKTYEDLTKEIDMLESKNKDYYDRLNNAQAYIDNHEEVWKRNTEIQLKRFAEKLKVEAIKLGGEGLGITDIDKILKEFLK